MSAQTRGGGPNAPDIKVVDQFDVDENGRLDAAERKKARAWLAERQAQRGPGRRGPGRRGRRGGPGGLVAGKPGPKVSPDQVRTYADKPLYDTGSLRTIFLNFENEDWEKELAEFKPTDVEVPATMMVDGKTYKDVGVSFRGASSFFRIPEGGKRSLNLSVDFVHGDQRLYGFKTLNLLNCSGDASMMSSYLYHAVVSPKIAAPKMNFVKVVINGRSWGVYASAQQFNKDFLEDHYDSRSGARWKVDGSPNGDGGLRYTGDNLEEYRKRYAIKSKEDPKAWADLVELCRVLNETPAAELETALKPILDLDGVLWFLAADVALINSDGYWTRASDYSIYQNKKGVFHILPHDMNEAFRPSRGGGPGGRGRGRGFGGPPGGGPLGAGRPFGRGPGDENGPDRFGPPPRDGGRDFRGPDRDGADRQRQRGDAQQDGRGRFGPPGGFGQGSRGGGYELDPLVGLDNPRFPLRSKLLANQTLKTRYLRYLRTIAQDHLDWKRMGPRIAAARQLIQSEVEADTRKLMTYDAFLKATDPKTGSLREFCTKRAEYLLKHPAISALSDDSEESTDTDSGP